MTTDSFFSIACMSMIVMFFGFVVAFAGYRFFMFLLPIWGFFFGFGLGAQAIQAIFANEGFLVTATSWIVGFFTALLFAVLSYLFYFAAVAIIAGALGYSVGAGLMMAIGFDFGFLVWIVGLAAGIALAVVVLMFNVQKWVILLATSVLGAGVITGAFLFLFGKLPSAALVQNPVKAVLDSSPFWFIIFLVVAVLGFIAQYQTSQRWKIESYNRWEELSAEPATPA